MASGRKRSDGLILAEVTVREQYCATNTNPGAAQCPSRSRPPHAAHRRRRRVRRRPALGVGTLPLAISTRWGFAHRHRKDPCTTEVKGASVSRGGLPVTGSDVASLVAVGPRPSRWGPGAVAVSKRRTRVSAWTAGHPASPSAPSRFHAVSRSARLRSGYGWLELLASAAPDAPDDVRVLGLTSMHESLLDGDGIEDLSLGGVRRIADRPRSPYLARCAGSRCRPSALRGDAPGGCGLQRPPGGGRPRRRAGLANGPWVPAGRWPCAREVATVDRGRPTFADLDLGPSGAVVPPLASASRSRRR